jgi:hypothetical protein
VAAAPPRRCPVHRPTFSSPCRPSRRTGRRPCSSPACQR